MRNSRFSVILLMLAAPWLTSCKKADGPAEKTNQELIKINIGYIGLTCEAPLFVAKEQGFFKEQGLEAEMVKTPWTEFKDRLGQGRFDVAHQPVMMFLKSIEQGMDVKMTAGVHFGCLRIQAPVNGKVQKIADLKGKRIGVPGMGTPPFVFASRVLGDNAMDPKVDVEWKVFPSAELGLALKKGEVDAIANAEPIGSLLLANGEELVGSKVKTIADQAIDKPYAGEYCCAVLINGAYVAHNSKGSAAATKAILKAAKWVETNPKAAVRLAIAKGYIASNPELNTEVLSHLHYLPSVDRGLGAVMSVATGMKKVGILDATTDVEELSKKAFVKFEGLSDDWIKQVQVEKVAQGQIPTDQFQRVVMELQAGGGPILARSCCSPD